ncbi:MAG: HAMP domain-containing sensor histidine kinase [Chryseolinea sp.]
MDRIVYRALQHDPELVNGLVDLLPYPFLIAGKLPNGSDIWIVNKQFSDEIGFKKEDIDTLEKWFCQAYPDETYRNSVRDLWYEKILDAHKSGESVFLHVRICTRVKGYQWYEVKASVADRLEFVGFVNINDAMVREHELQRINENKNRIISIIGHDLRTPILNLNRLTEFILESKLSMDEFSEYVRKANELSKSSLHFLETTLMWTKNNFTRISHTPSKISLKPWLEKLIALYSPAAEHKRIELAISVSANDKAFVDPEILHIIVRNILTNAIKFSKPNTKVEVSVVRLSDQVGLIIRDSGIGMNQQRIDAILNDGDVHLDSDHNIRDGFGMGLKLCQDVLKEVGGRLEIESQPNEGSTFFVFVPA